MTCPLCGGADLPVIRTELRNGPGTVRRCEGCDLEMLDGPPVDYTDGSYRATHGPVLGMRSTPAELYAAYRPHQDHRVAILQPHLGPAVKLLEAGCSVGAFLDAVKPHVHGAVGIEPDAEAAAFAMAQTRCAVVPRAADLPLGAFDVLALFQVVEHLVDPLAELGALVAHLAPAGVLCIEVPSLRDPLLTVYDNAAYRRFYYHEAHRFYFSPRSLRALVAKLGFAGDVYGVQDYTFLNHLHWAFTNRPQPTAGDGLVAKWPAGPLPHLGPVLDSFAVEVDRRYKGALGQAGCTENICFVGKRA